MLRIVYGLKLDCEVALRTRRIGWRDTTNTGGVNSQQSSSALTIGFAKATMIRMMKMKIFHSTSGHEALGSQGPSTVLAKGTRDPAYFQMRGERQTAGTAEAEKIREEVDIIDYNKKLVYEGEIEEDSKLSGNPSILGRSRAQCSGIVRTFRHNNNTLLSRGAAVF